MIKIALLINFRNIKSVTTRQTKTVKKNLALTCQYLIQVAANYTSDSEQHNQTQNQLS